MESELISSIQIEASEANATPEGTVVRHKTCEPTRSVSPGTAVLYPDLRRQDPEVDARFVRTSPDQISVCGIGIYIDDSTRGIIGNHFGFGMGFGSQISNKAAKQDSLWNPDALALHQPTFINEDYKQDQMKLSGRRNGITPNRIGQTANLRINQKAGNQAGIETQARVWSHVPTSAICQEKLGLRGNRKGGNPNRTDTKDSLRNHHQAV